MPIEPFQVGAPPVSCERCDFRRATGTIEMRYGQVLSLCDGCRLRYFTECADCDMWVDWNQTVNINAAHDAYDEDDGYDDRDPERVVCRDCARGSEYEACEDCGGFYDASGEPCCVPPYPRMSSDPVPHLFPQCGCSGPAACRSSQHRGYPPPAMSGRNARINNYSHRPPLEFKGVNNGEPHQAFFGVEVELTAGNPERMVAEAAALLGHHFYFKSDASISRGFELVTHPMTYRWAMEEFPWNGWDILSRRGIGSDDSTGMHIHVNKSTFGSASHDLRWLTFFYRNRHMVEKVARRSNSSFARFSGSEGKLIVPMKKTGQQRCGKCDLCRMTRAERYGSDDYYRECRHRLQRYAAINLTNNATYEARVFASSIHPVHIKGALALMAATIEYTRTLTSADVMKRRGYEWGTFIAWVNDRPEYAPLVECINDIDKNGVRA